MPIKKMVGNFLIGVFATFCAVWIPILTTLLAQTPSSDQASAFNNNFIIISVIFSCLIGGVVVIFTYNSPKTPGETFLLALGIPALIAAAVGSNVSSTKFDQQIKENNKLVKFINNKLGGIELTTPLKNQFKTIPGDKNKIGESVPTPSSRKSSFDFFSIEGQANAGEHEGLQGNLTKCFGEERGQDFSIEDFSINKLGRKTYGVAVFYHSEENVVEDWIEKIGTPLKIPMMKFKLFEFNAVFLCKNLTSKEDAIVVASEIRSLLSEHIATTFPASESEISLFHQRKLLIESLSTEILGKERLYKSSPSKDLESEISWLKRRLKQKEADQITYLANKTSLDHRSLFEGSKPRIVNLKNILEN